MQLFFSPSWFRLKEKRKLVGPNNGFENQLRLYETLKYTLREDNLQYKMFRLRVTANKVAKGNMELFKDKLNRNV